MANKYKLKGEKEWLEDDLMEREWRMQRELTRIAEKERKRGRTWIRYDKIQIEMYGENEMKRRMY